MDVNGSFCNTQTLKSVQPTTHIKHGSDYFEAIGSLHWNKTL